MPTDDDSSRDAFLEATVERSLAPYRALVSPETLAVMREMLAESLTEDEVGRDLLERAWRSRAPLQTGERRSNGKAEPDSKAGGSDE